jgi:hypothetical protein
MLKTLLAALVAAACALAPAGAAPPCYDLGHAGTCPALEAAPALACPSHRYACWQVRAAVRLNGEETWLRARGTVAGASARSRRRRKCLR